MASTDPAADTRSLFLQINAVLVPLQGLFRVLDIIAEVVNIAARSR